MSYFRKNITEKEFDTLTEGRTPKREGDNPRFYIYKLENGTSAVMKRTNEGDCWYIDNQ